MHTFMAEPFSALPGGKGLSLEMVHSTQTISVCHVPYLMSPQESEGVCPPGPSLLYSAHVGLGTMVR